MCQMFIFIDQIWDWIEIQDIVCIIWNDRIWKISNPKSSKENNLIEPNDADSVSVNRYYNYKGFQQYIQI